MDAHVSSDQLAELLENGSSRSPEAEATRQHLEACPACQGLYRAALDSLREVDLTTSVPEGYLPATVEPAADKEPTGGPFRLRPIPAVVSAAAAVAAVALFVFTGNESAPLPVAPEALQSALSRSSSAGLVLPGGVADAPEAPVFRSGSADTSLMAYLAEMESEIGSEEPLPLEDGAWLVSGYLAVDRLDQARSWLELLSEVHGDHAHLHVLAGILSYRENDLERAEEYFRLVEGTRPWGELARLDLALVLAENGKRDRAVRILKELSERAESAEIRSRASRELEQGL